MPDRKMVIKGLQCIIDGTVRCESCGYAIDKHGHYSCQQECAKDAIALLKEQEDCIRILTSDLEDLQKEHAKLLDKKIPLITNGQEVVRCADCKHHGKDVCGAASGIAYPPPDDWFCADGERE